MIKIAPLFTGPVSSGFKSIIEHAGATRTPETLSHLANVRFGQAQHIARTGLQRPGQFKELLKSSINARNRAVNESFKPQIVAQRA